jgi:hydroxymethylpyrimidine pyrophosphatase-like HAD family hydrolase
MIRLLSIDFDGTLADTIYPEYCSASLDRELSAAVSGGALWAVNTGRSLESALDGLRGLGASVTPDYILTNERHIHRPDGKGGWLDYGDWNEICREHHDLLFKESGSFFDRISALVASHEGVVFQQLYKGIPEGLVAASEEQLDQVISELEALPGRPGDFHYQRSNIYLRFCHRRYDKGSALAELSRLIEMPSSEILAIGDHQNDLPMLFGEVAAMVACPSNSHPSVKDAVSKAGGHVSKLPAGEGTAEAIHLYRTGKKFPAEKRNREAVLKDQLPG